MGLFTKKTDKKLVVLMMDTHVHGELQHVMEEMGDKGKQYAMENVRVNFVKVMYGKSIKAYRDENITVLFPNQWEAPLYRREQAGMDRIAVECVREHIRKTMPQVNAEAVDVVIQSFAGKEFAGASFVYD